MSKLLKFFKPVRCPLADVREMLDNLNKDYNDELDVIQRLKYLKRTGKLFCKCMYADHVDWIKKERKKLESILKEKTKKI